MNIDLVLEYEFYSNDVYIDDERPCSIIYYEDNNNTTIEVIDNNNIQNTFDIINNIGFVSYNFNNLNIGSINNNIFITEVINDNSFTNNDLLIGELNTNIISPINNIINNEIYFYLADIIDSNSNIDSNIYTSNEYFGQVLIGYNIYDLENLIHRFSIEVLDNALYKYNIEFNGDNMYLYTYNGFNYIIDICLMNEGFYIYDVYGALKSDENIFSFYVNGYLNAKADNICLNRGLANNGLSEIVVYYNVGEYNTIFELTDKYIQQGIIIRNVLYKPYGVRFNSQKVFGLLIQNTIHDMYVVLSNGELIKVTLKPKINFAIN